MAFLRNERWMRTLIATSGIICDEILRSWF
jgi:hypothetical protein